MSRCPGQMLDAQAEALGKMEERIRARGWNLGFTQVSRIQIRLSVKVCRNESCPCGSGLKYKRCLGQPE